MMLALTLAGLHLLLGWRIFGRLPQTGAAAVPARATSSLSVIVPARDEAHNLPRLLQSLAEQQIRPLEVLVVDDHSTDATAQIATDRGARVIPSAPLPESWRGKTWACQQGATQAKGDLLLFLDADTWLQPEGLQRLLSHHTQGATSVLPWHDIQLGHEQYSLFFNLLMAAGSCPQNLFGQVLLIDREAYFRAGGHETVKGRVLENGWLGLHMRSLGIPVRSFLGRQVVSLRMYPEGISSVVAGWMKGFASGAGLTPAGRMVAIVIWLSGLMIPLVCLGLGVGLAATLLLYAAGAAQVAFFSRSVGRFSLGMAALYPAPLLFFFWVFARSARRGGKPLEWKGRMIHDP